MPRPETRKRIKVIEFGEVPPPFGGVTVHMSRLLVRLHQDGFDLTHVTRRLQPGGGAYSSVRWPTFPKYLNHVECVRGIAAPFGDGILHLHDNPVFFAPLIALHILRGGAALITVHDQFLPERLKRALPHERVAFWLVTRSSRVSWIAVSRNVRELLRRRKIPIERICIISAFLPRTDGPSGTALPTEVTEFLHSHNPAMIVYGYKRDFLSGRDLYGFDYAIRVLRELIRTTPEAGLIILCPSASRDDPAWQPLIKDVRSLGLTNRVLFVFKPLENPFALWASCSVMLRPTLTDGDSTAVREMLALGLPVIASDITPRPVGTRVVGLDSPVEWAHAVTECINNWPHCHTRPQTPIDGYNAIRKVLLALGGTK